LYRPQWHRTSSGIWNRFRYPIDIDRNLNNPKMYWKLLKMISKGKTSTDIPPLFCPVDDTTIHNSIKCEVLNNYFISISDITSSLL